MEYRKATLHDWKQIDALYKNARFFMAATGNKKQWANLEEVETRVKENIEKGRLVVGLDYDEIRVAFMIADYEPTYEQIDGPGWTSDAPYKVVHLFATKVQGSGIGAFAMRDLQREYDHIRIDTHKDNKPMHALLKKMGFVYCGVIRLENGDPRDAFEWAK